MLRNTQFCKTLFLGAVFFFTFLMATAQYYIKILAPNVDTLYAKLQDANDRKKMKLCNELAFFYSLSDVDSAFHYANLAYEMAGKQDDLYEKGSALRNLGHAFALSGNYREAVRHLQQALNIFEELNDLRKISELYADLGKLNYDMEDYEKSLQYIDKLLNLLDQEDKKGHPLASDLEKSILLGLSGGAAREAKDYDLALKYFKECIRLGQRTEIPTRAMAVFIKSLAEAYTYTGMIDSALKYTYLARWSLPENKNLPINEPDGYQHALGDLFYRKGEIKKAMPLLLEAYELERKAGSYYYAAGQAFRLGDHYLNNADDQKAFYWYEKGREDAAMMHLQLLEEESDTGQQVVYSGYQVLLPINKAEMWQRYYRLMVNNHRRMYGYQKSVGNFAKALEHHEKMYDYRDSLNTLRSNLEERKMQVRYESEKMEQEITLLQRDNELKQLNLYKTRLVFAAVMLILLFILLSIITYFRQRRVRESQEKLILEQRLFRSQMNPHFIFNALGSIQSSIISEEPDKAARYLSRFSKLMRSILDSSMEEVVTLEEELETIENYLELQKVRYAGKFDYSMDIDPGIDVENSFIPPMLAQPFIENAVEHGIRNKEGMGRIDIRCKRGNEVTIFEVEDDGVGREKAQEMLFKQNKNHKSLATAITLERIAALNRRSKQKITMEIIDLKDENGESRGTLVRFGLPF